MAFDIKIVDVVVECAQVECTFDELINRLHRRGTSGVVSPDLYFRQALGRALVALEKAKYLTVDRSADPFTYSASVEQRDAAVKQTDLDQSIRDTFR